MTEKFIFIRQIDDGTEIRHESSNVVLPDLLEDIACFLRGVGFGMDGCRLEIVEEDDFIREEDC